MEGIEILNVNPTFNEFVMKTHCDATDVIEQMSANGFYAGINLGNIFEGLENAILVSVTEKRTKEQMDSFVQALGEVI
jgi:glycine dehydrogenase subunit 1